MLLRLTTRLPRLLLPVVVFAVWAPAANAWSWPIQGPVLRPFSYDEAHPYAAGQHRGIDIGADAAGEVVSAPAAGTVSFAGTVPTNGKSLTIETADGYSVTLTHLGSISVVKGTAVAERDPIGTIGPSGTPEEAGPYVHLGIRVSADSNGYVDPLSLLPPPAESGATQDDSPASQPASSGGSATSSTNATAPAALPASSSPSVATTRGSTVAPGRGHAPVRERARDSRAGDQAGSRASGRSSESGRAGAHVSPHRAAPHHRVNRPSSSQRPVVETSAPGEPAGLGTGHELRPERQGAELAVSRLRRAGLPLSLALNGAAALVALAAAFAAGRRRRSSRSVSTEGAQVVQLPRPTLERRAA
jgi:Peptidase family M23